MRRIVKLTDSLGDDIYVNADFVELLKPAATPNETFVYTTGGKQHVVRGAVAEIARLINGEAPPQIA